MSSSGKRSFLDSIPGWSGYRDRERRRESDRLLRERLARDYGEIASELGRLAARMAQDRKLMAIRFVDGPHGRLTHFTDRLKTATYGYAGLFSDRPVDAAALDQIAAFDESLGEGLAALSLAATALEDTDPDSPLFQDRSEELSELIEDLLNRFDRRAELIESGGPLPEGEITSLLVPETTRQTPTAYQLHDGDGISFDNQNYTVVGRITIETESSTWRDFQLRGGDGQTWLRVPESAEAGFKWLHRIETGSEYGSASIQIRGDRFELESTIVGMAEVIGTGGSSGTREVTIYTYRAFSGNNEISVYHWRADEIALMGASIDADELELWSREGGEAI